MREPQLLTSLDEWKVYKAAVSDGYLRDEHIGEPEKFPCVVVTVFRTYSVRGGDYDEFEHFEEWVHTFVYVDLASKLLVAALGALPKPEPWVPDSGPWTAPYPTYPTYPVSPNTYPMIPVYPTVPSGPWWEVTWPTTLPADPSSTMVILKDRERLESTAQIRIAPFVLPPDEILSSSDESRG